MSLLGVKEILYAILYQVSQVLSGLQQTLKFIETFEHKS